MENYIRGIQTEDIIVSISNTSRIPGGQPHDIASIDSVIQLASQENQDVSLLLPAEDTDPQVAYLRVLDDVDTKVQVEPPVKSDELPEDIKNIIDELRSKQEAEWKQIQKITDLFSVGRIKLKAGDQELKYYRQKPVIPRPDGLYEFRLLAPLASFQTTGTTNISLVIILPRGAQLVEVQVEGPNPGMNIPQYQQTVVGVRTALHWVLTQDPLFKVVYRY